MVRKRGRSAVLEALRCDGRGKTQHFAAKEFPAAVGLGLFAKTEE
jgi:hypothetical protein